MVRAGSATVGCARVVVAVAMSWFLNGAARSGSGNASAGHDFPTNTRDCSITTTPGVHMPAALCSADLLRAVTVVHP